MRFPVDSYVDSFLYRPARFGNSRPGGRTHAGCDLYVPEGTPVRAVADGVLREDLSSFYLGTASIVVDHVFFIVRYGELSLDPPIASGVYSNPRFGRIEEGRILGYVRKTPVARPMLHFEMYSGAAVGPLTNRTNRPTQRRSDLVDPTGWLLKVAFKRRNPICE